MTQVPQVLIQPFPDHKAPKDFKARWVLRVLLAQTLLWRDPLVLKGFKVKLDPKAPQD